MGEDTVIYAMGAVLSLLAVIVGLSVRAARQERKRLREQIAKMVRDMDSLIHSRNPSEIKRIGVIVNRIRTLARSGGTTPERMGISEGRLQNYVDRMHSRLEVLLKPPSLPENLSPPGAWRFESGSDDEEIIFDTSEIDALQPPGRMKIIPVAELLMEVIAADEPPEDGVMPPYSLEEFFEGLTDGDIEGHIEEYAKRSWPVSS